MFQGSLAMDALETNGGPAADIAEIEQIVKEKMVRFNLMHAECAHCFFTFLGLCTVHFVIDSKKPCFTIVENNSKHAPLCKIFA